MAAPHYTPSGKPVQGSAGSSKDLRDEFLLVETGIQVLNSIPIIAHFSDANTAGQVYVGVPWDCTITKVYITNDVSNTTTDTIFTLKIAGVAVTDGAGTLLSSAQLGTVVTITPTALNAIAAGQGLEIETDGGGSPVMPCNCTCLFERT